VIRLYWLVLGVLATWRITHLLQAEDGPWEVIVSLRRAAGSCFVGRLLDCFYCLTVWIAAPLALWIGDSWRERVLLWPTLSAGAILLQCVTEGREQDVSPAPYLEDAEDEYGMLRKEKAAAPPDDRAETSL
jgi:hypothetical protein